MQLMTTQQVQDQQQRQQGYFSMPEEPTLQEQLDAVDQAFEDHQQAQFEQSMK